MTSVSSGNSFAMKFRYIKSSVLTRLLVTFGAIIIYRFATFITLPGIDYAALSKLYTQYAKSFFMFNALSGGALSRMSIMSLNLVPYISSTIIMQLAVAASPALKELKRDPMQRRVMNNYARFLSLFISIFHSIGLCFILESMPGIVINPTWGFRLMTILCVATSSLIALWLSERISTSGISNGTSVITFLNIIASSSYPTASFIWSVLTGAIGFGMRSSVILALLALAILCSFVFEISSYNIFVFFKKSTKHDAITYQMPIKLNPVGILPAMFAESIIGPISLLCKNIIFPKLCSFYEVFSGFIFKITSIDITALIVDSTYYTKYIISNIMHYVYFVLNKVFIFLQDPAIVNYFHAANDGIIGSFHNETLVPAIMLIVKSILLIFFAFFCLDFAMEPGDISHNLRSRNISAVGYCEGDQTTQFFSVLLNTISNLGAICLVLICALIPFALDQCGMSMSGTSIVITIGVAIELFYKFRSILI